MPDATVSSLTEPNMMKYPLLMQAPTGETAYPYSVNDLRLLSRLAVLQDGVSSGNDFLISNGPGAQQVTISSGIGVSHLASGSALERYAFAGTGNVILSGVYANGGGSPLNHVLYAQPLDRQLSYSSGATGWVFDLSQDTGSGAPVLSNAIPLWQITVAPGQTSGYAFTDLRQPFNGKMCAKISMSTTTALTANVRHAIPYTVTAEDLYKMTNLTVDSGAINIRTSGLWDIWVTVLTSAGGGELEVGMYTGSSTSNLIAGSQQKNPGSSSGGTIATGFCLSELLASGTALRAYAFTTVAGINILTSQFRASLREIR